MQIGWWKLRASVTAAASINSELPGLRKLVGKEGALAWLITDPSRDSFPQQVCFQELAHELQVGLVIKFGTAMPRSMNNLELYRKSEFLIAPLQLVRLIDRHLWILVPMNQQEWGVGPVHVKERAGKLCNLCVVFRLTAEQQL